MKDNNRIILILYNPFGFKSGKRAIQRCSSNVDLSRYSRSGKGKCSTQSAAFLF